VLNEHRCAMKDPSETGQSYSLWWWTGSLQSLLNRSNKLKISSLINKSNVGFKFIVGDAVDGEALFGFFDVFVK